MTERQLMSRRICNVVGLDFLNCLHSSFTREIIYIISCLLKENYILIYNTLHFLSNTTRNTWQIRTHLTLLYIFLYLTTNTVECFNIWHYFVDCFSCWGELNLLTSGRLWRLCRLRVPIRQLGFCLNDHCCKHFATGGVDTWPEPTVWSWKRRPSPLCGQGILV